jgi:5-methyltetrahydropteroyltriglutamate--homocysteine methyltransferase
MSNSGLDMLELFKKRRYTKDLSLGVVDVHSHVIEEDKEVEQRLRRALEVLPKEAIWVDPDCGLKTRTVDEAIAKMQSVVTAAKALRAVTSDKE